jgi:hypothetical protein
MQCKEVQILQIFENASKIRGRHCPFIMKAEKIEFENKRLYVVLELMEMTLTQFLRKRLKSPNPKLDEQTEIRVIMKQLISGI